MGVVVGLRAAEARDLWLLERQAVDAEAAGAFNWSGFRDPARVRRRYEQDGLFGADGGRLIVTVDDAPAGYVVWSRTTYGVPAWWCWNIGIALLPEFRGHGVGSRAQALLVAHLFDTTPVVRVEAYTDVENEAEQRSLEKVGFRRDGVLRATQFRAGGWRDLFLYSLLRAEFSPDPH